MRRLSELTVDEIRQRYIRGAARLSPQLLSQLKNDQREGVRKLGSLLGRRYDRERAARAHLDAMLNFERVLWKSGVTRIAGVDESGMGPLAGPVVAAAVVFPPDTEIEGIDDSKKVDPLERERLGAAIRAQAAGIGIGIANVGEVDQLNIYQAGLLAMRRAIDTLPVRPQHILVDARTIPELEIPQNCFNRGDGINFSIAAASIVAKTHRDRLMDDLDRQYPEYGFSRHKGYGTPEHQDALRVHGPCPIHRMSFNLISELCGEYSTGFYELKQQLDLADTADGLNAFAELLESQRACFSDAELKKLRVMLARRWKTL